MLLSEVVATKLGYTVDIDYVTAMLMNIALWLAVAPLAAASARKKFFGCK